MKDIKQAENKFFIGQSEDKAIAEITFVNYDDNTIIIDHTYVDDQFRGQGIARKLLDKVVDYARNKNKKIIPECSYARKVMINNVEFSDVIAK